MKKHIAVASLLLMGGLAAFADISTPSYTTFSTLSGATFGGTGIPNNAVAISTVNTGTGDTLTLGLTATARYQNPTVGNNGTGTFSATPGSNNGLTSPGHSIGPTWNFDWYINLQDVSQTFYQFKLTYEDLTTGSSSSYTFGPYGDTSGTSQDSWNLGMGFLNTGTFTFDPNATDNYGIELDAVGVYGNDVASSVINVDISNPNGSNSRVPDGTATAGLLGLGFVGLLAFRRNQLRYATVKK